MSHSNETSTAHEFTSLSRLINADSELQIRHPLGYAAACSTPDIFQLLLDRGAKLEQSNPLHAAAGTVTHGSGEKQIEMVGFLLDKGMDINSIEFANDKSLWIGGEVKPYLNPIALRRSLGMGEQS